MSRRFDASKYLLAALAEVPRFEEPLGCADGSADAGDDALAASAALWDDALLPDDVEHGIAQLQAVDACPGLEEVGSATSNTRLFARAADANELS